MTAPVDLPDAGGGLLAPRPDRMPADRCVRCGKETPAGVALCEEHNPGRLRGPSATQMHATVFIGVVLGVVGFFLLARGAVITDGPFLARVTAATIDAAGAIAVSLSITNEGRSEGMADCRVTRDGVPRPDDVAFRSPRLPAGETVALDRLLDPTLASFPAYDAERLSVICV